MYHVRYRMYHPTLGRWLQRDPVGYVDGMGLYEYMGSRPVAHVDPTGLAWTQEDCEEYFRGNDPNSTWSDYWNSDWLYGGLFGDDRPGHGSDSWDYVAGKRRMVDKAVFALNTAARKEPPGSGNRKMLSKALRKARALQRTTQHHYRFWRFMEKHGCGCCSLRLFVEDKVKGKNWKSGYDKTSKALKRTFKLIRYLAKRVAGKPVPVGDPTGALGAYEPAKQAIKSIGLDIAHREACIAGNVKKEPGCPKLKGIDWRRDVDDNGNPG